MFAFGRHPGEDIKTAAAWGARAIFKHGEIDLLHDRMQMVGGDDQTRQELAAWINKTGLPKVKALVSRLYGGDSDVVTFDDGRFHIEASPQASHGYLYIGAWKLEP
jgi:hypothetical protein